MTNIAAQRIQREFREVVGDESSKSLYHIEEKNSNLLDLVGYITGPPDSPYEGGKFHLEIKVPETYPFNPPKIKFTTRLWHPNVSSATGAICLDILKDQWAAAMTMRTVLLSLQTLLALPEPSDPQDAVVARQCTENIELFKMTARYWTFIYALPAPHSALQRFRMTHPSMAKFQTGKNIPAKFIEFNSKVMKLVDIMRIDEFNSMHALSSHNWDLDRATQSLL